MKPSMQRQMFMRESAEQMPHFTQTVKMLDCTLVVVKCCRVSQVGSEVVQCPGCQRRLRGW
jgi:hypothetical protein